MNAIGIWIFQSYDTPWTIVENIFDGLIEDDITVFQAPLVLSGFGHGSLLCNVTSLSLLSGTDP